MGQEKSLNDPIKDGESDEWQDWLVDESLDQELLVSHINKNIMIKRITQ